MQNLLILIRGLQDLTVAFHRIVCIFFTAETQGRKVYGGLS
jgi:hypothetical protein